MDSGEIVPRGEIGAIEVKGPNVFRGYWRMPEKTAQEFRSDGFLITGDLARADADGYIHLVGGTKELVISGGFNVYPKEVENEIDALDGVLESAVFGAPHPDFGEGVTTVVVPHPGAPITEFERTRRAQRAARQIQVAEAGLLRRVPASQCDGQSSEGDAARDRLGSLCCSGYLIVTIVGLPATSLP